MCYRVVPDRDEVLKKLKINQRVLVWQFASTSYSDIVIAVLESYRLQRVWDGIPWHIILDDADNAESWARAVMKYRAKGVFA